MTTSIPGARHITPRLEDVRPRLSRLGKLDELTGQEPPVQRAANELIAAERQLSHVQTRYLEARRTGDSPSISLAASRQDGAIRRIERLRAQLYAERRRELLEAGADRVRFGPARRPSLIATPAGPLTTERRIALGVYAPGFPRDPTALDRYTQLAGRPPAIVHYFQRWSPDGEFQPEAVAASHAVGAMPMISWEPWQGLAPIVSGELDDYIGSYADAVAAVGQPLLIRFAHEMNLPGIPWHGPAALYRQAWTRLREIFDARDVRNAGWVWSPYVDGRGIDPLGPYYPGADLVDWVALDGYNWGRRRWYQRWHRFDAIFAASYASLRNLAPDKLMMLAEIGCSPRGGDKAAWMRDALLRAIPERYPQISAVVWFNQDRRDHADWRVDSSPPTLEAWREAVADPRYALPGRELPLR